MSSDEARSARSRLFADPSFRWIFVGGAVSILGDQLTMIALPWLILMLTGDPLALGAVFIVESLPRAVFLLVGGALVDRHSPKRMLIATKWGNAALLGLLALLVFTGTLTPWMIYAMALVMGLTSAFSDPASGSLLAHILPPGLLHAGNSALMGVRQTATLLGPALAGLLIAVFHDGRSSGMADSRGLSVAFAFDAFSFVFSAWAFRNIRSIALAADTQDARPLVREIMDGFRHFWGDRALRTLFLYYACIAFVTQGPLLVALPVLCKLQLTGGAASFGLLIAAHGGGMLLGTGLTGAKPHWRLGTLGSMILLADALTGLAMLPFGRIGAPWQGMALLAPIGVLEGFMQVAVFSWIQNRIPAHMLGRIMSLITLIFVVLAPLSASVTGALLRVTTPQWIFSGSGLSMLLFALAGAGWTNIRNLVEASPESSDAFDPVTQADRGV
jgi:MFS family permease